jgi:hypothetical protein
MTRAFIPAAALQTATALLAALLFASCDKPTPPPPPPDKKLLSVADLESPRDSAPAVDSVNYEQGYADGTAAGETAARALPLRSKTPKPDDLAVLALEAAGSDTARGPRWQRGYASGYRDGFERISSGKK